MEPSTAIQRSAAAAISAARLAPSLLEGDAYANWSISAPWKKKTNIYGQDSRKYSAPSEATMANFLPVAYDLPACVRCAACGQVVELTWTSSCEGYEIYCGTCYQNHNM